MNLVLLDDAGVIYSFSQKTHRLDKASLWAKQKMHQVHAGALDSSPPCHTAAF